MDQEQEAWMSVLLADLRAENEQLRAIAQVVATDNTTYYDGYDDQKCVFCEGEELWEGEYQHTDECIVTRARAMLQKREEK